MNGGSGREFDWKITDLSNNGSSALQTLGFSAPFQLEEQGSTRKLPPRFMNESGAGCSPPPGAPTRPGQPVLVLLARMWHLRPATSHPCLPVPVWQLSPAVPRTQTHTMFQGGSRNVDPGTGTPVSPGSPQGAQSPAPSPGAGPSPRQETPVWGRIHPAPLPPPGSSLPLTPAPVWDLGAAWLWMQ